MPNPPAAPPAASRTQRLLPGFWQLRHYDRSWLRGDLIAGVTVAAYLVPQVMAYAEVAGLPAIVGLWAVVGPLTVYAVLGTSRQLSVGPESTTALMTAAAVGALVAGSPGRYAEVAAALAIAVGVLCVLGWFGRLGFLSSLLSRPVLIGYLAGIAVLMIISQLGKITRIDPGAADSTYQELVGLARQLGQTHLPTLGLALVMLALLFVTRALFPRLPGPLMVMLLAAALVTLLDLDRHGVAVIGEIPRGLPAPAVPDFSGLHLATLFPAALGIALVGYSDNVLTARALASKRREVIDSGQEFLALGAANIAAGLFHGFPVSSSGSRTVLGDAMGSRSQLYSLVAMASVLLTMYFFGPVLAVFPRAALGAVVIYAATRLIDVGELRRIGRFRRSELVLALATAAAVLVLGVLAGIGVAIALSILDIFRRIAKPHDGVLGYVPGVPGMHDVDDYISGRQVPGLVVYRYDSPLFFANAEDFKARALRAVDEADGPVDWFLLNAEANVEVDLTAVDALDDLRRTLADRGITFAMARVKRELHDSLHAAGFAQDVGEERIFATLPTAVDAYLQWYAATYGSEPPGLQRPPR